MATKYGRLDYDGYTFEEQTFHKNKTVTSASNGVNYVLAKRDEYAQGDAYAKVLTNSGIHWAFIHNLFYSSGSQKILDEQPADAAKYDNIYNDFNQHNDLKPFFTTKFNTTASVFYIPQQHFDQRIKPNSFQLTARTGSSSNTTKQIIIVDDGNGNLYSSNAHSSQSADTSLSSKDNYVGNIFYDLGIAILTETGSWSGSVNYNDIGRESSTEDKDYRFWDIKFNSSTLFFTSQYTIHINPGDFNSPTNHSSRPALSGSLPSGSSQATYSNLRHELTSGSFTPYFNQIHLYRNQTEEPILIANLPRNIKMRDDVDIIITFRVDH